MIVEDGTGLTNANSLVSVAYATSYFSARNNPKWSDLEDEDKEVCLIKATDYINSAYKYRGIKASAEQSLNFPRNKMIDDNGFVITGVPNAVKDAVCECALLIANGTEMFEKHNGKGAVTSEHIGSLAFTYDVSKAVKDTSLYDAINLRLRGLVIDTNSGKIITGRVSRA